MSDRSVPATLSHYRVDELLGRGGMGSVYRGADRRDESTVAIKVMHQHLVADVTFRNRFTREAHVAALLRSPYTVHLLDYGIAEDHLFLVMEYVDGHSLRDEIKRGPLTQGRALRVAIQVSRALEEAEARGVVHRDIKPDNILIANDDQVKVADFGIARQVGNAGLTVVGGYVGTPAYSAPEQLRGQTDHRTDFYALGCVLYESLAGRPPGSRRSEAFAHPRFGVLPKALRLLIQRCLAEDPDERFARAAELTAELERVLLETEDSPTETELREGASTQAVIPVEAKKDPPGSGNGSVHARVNLSVRLSLDRHGMFGGRVGASTYMLALQNPSARELSIGLTAADPDDALLMSVPKSVALPANGSVTVPLRVRRRQMRWTGQREQRRFTITAKDGGGAAAEVHGTFGDVPMGMAPVGFFGLALVALVVLVAVFAIPRGGGDNENGQPGSVSTLDRELVETLLSPESLFRAIAAAAQLSETALQESWPDGLTLEESLVDLGLSREDVVTDGVAFLLERFEARHDGDNASIDEFRSRATAAIETFLRTPRSQFESGVGSPPVMPTAVVVITPSVPTPTAAISDPTPPVLPTTLPPEGPNRIAQGEWTYTFTVVENECGQGLPFGESVTIGFTLTAFGSADTFIRTGDVVSVFESSTGSFIGDYAMVLPVWQISYAIAAGFFQDTGQFFSGGTATLTNHYLGETSGFSTLEEVYQVNGSSCRITFLDS